LEARAFGPKETQQRLVLPDAHRLTAEVRRAPQAVTGAVSIGVEDRRAEYVVERFVGIDHERPRRLYLRERERTSVDEAGPLALYHPRPRRACKLHRMVARTGVEHQDLHSTGK